MSRYGKRGNVDGRVPACTTRREHRVTGNPLRLMGEPHKPRAPNVARRAIAPRVVRRAPARPATYAFACAVAASCCCCCASSCETDRERSIANCLTSRT
jgi:hypothetical protein